MTQIRHGVALTTFSSLFTCRYSLPESSVLMLKLRLAGILLCCCRPDLFCGPVWMCEGVCVAPLDAILGLTISRVHMHGWYILGCPVARVFVLQLWVI